MTPQLRQAIRLLQMSSLELETAIAEELENNPFLEREGALDADGPAETPFAGSESGDRDGLPDLFDSTGAEECPPDTNDEPIEDSFYEQASDAAPGFEPDFSMNPSTGAGAAGYDADFSAVDLCAAKPPSLSESVERQIRLAFGDENDRKTARALAERLDSNGWLSEKTDDVCSAETLNRILPALQSFAPTGLFARDLSECLALQLKERDRFDPAMAAMIARLDLVAKREYKQLAKICGVDADDVADMIDEIKRLNPRPASAFDDAVPAAVVPDVLLRRAKNGDFVVELNQAVLPRVLINRSYAARVAGLAKGDKAAKKFLTQHLSAANWLIRALNQRAETILKVAAEIVDRQRDFFLRGEAALKPMILRDVADAAGLHESTVSRVTAQKYIACPAGVFELKYFFSRALETEDGGDAVSAQAVKRRVRELIGAEDKNGVLSDEALVAALKSEGIEIARRTVAKYRESMGIPTSAQRKRDKRRGGD